MMWCEIYDECITTHHCMIEREESYRADRTREDMTELVSSRVAGAQTKLVYASIAYRTFVIIDDLPGLLSIHLIVVVDLFGYVTFCHHTTLQATTIIDYVRSV